jgi:hypothetical protein
MDAYSLFLVPQSGPTEIRRFFLPKKCNAIYGSVSAMIFNFHPPEQHS